MDRKEMILHYQNGGCVCCSAPLQPKDSYENPHKPVGRYESLVCSGCRILLARAKTPEQARRMVTGLLRYSLDRILSVKSYYETLRPTPDP